MLSEEIQLEYIGGPTIVLTIDGLRFITDPTFDQAPSRYELPVYTLEKTQSPNRSAASVGTVDYVLLSHDHHLDNLDNSGRAFLSTVKKVFTTPAGAGRLGNNAVGLEHWQCVEIDLPSGGILQIIGTPCQHGPADAERGPVTGFVLKRKSEDGGAVYVSGDTVWFKGVEEVSQRYEIGMAILFMGAAIVKEVGSKPLTMTADDGVIAAEHFTKATIVPVHFEGWKHFSQSRNEIETAFARAGLSRRLRWPWQSREEL